MDIFTVGGALSSKKSVQPEKIGAINNNISRDARGRTCFIMWSPTIQQKLTQRPDVL